jgi:hypothetical protein
MQNNLDTSNQDASEMVKILKSPDKKSNFIGFTAVEEKQRI